MIEVNEKKLNFLLNTFLWELDDCMEERCPLYPICHDTYGDDPDCQKLLKKWLQKA